MIRTIFSEYLWSHFCDIDLKKLKTHMLQTRKKDPKGREVSNLGGWQSQGFIKPNKQNYKLFNIIDQEIKKLNNELNFKSLLTLDNYWYNINKKASYNAPHVHAGGNTVVSGVFYIETPKKSGDIVFERTDNCLKNLYWDKGGRVNKINQYNSGRFIVNPEPNLLLLFSAATLHFVEPSQTNKERFSISFNYRHEF